MRKWNALEMRKLFEEKAKEKGCALTEFLKQFANELDEEYRINIHYTTLNKYLWEGNKGPTKGEEKQALYKKIEKDFGYDMLGKEQVFLEDVEYFLEDKTEKLPKFCQEHLEAIFKTICSYLESAYRGEVSLLFENDFNVIVYHYMLCKPLLPNYVCINMQQFLEKKFAAIREEAEKDGLIIVEGVGIVYKDDLAEGREPDIQDYVFMEDYIEGNLEEHHERVSRFFEDIATFWETNVETLYAEGTRSVKEMREHFNRIRL